MARALGWFSIGLGVAEVAAPRAVARLIGVPERRGVLRLFGLREIATGVGILTQPRAAGWVWARVAGDALDLASLARAMRRDTAATGRVAAATGAVVAVTALDVWCGEELSRRANGSRAAVGSQRPLRVEKSLTIARPPEDVYRFWRNFENLPRFMTGLEAVRVTEEKRSHWVAKGPAATKVEWDAEIVDDRPNALIAWRSLSGAAVQNSGSVRFEPAPAGRGTIVRVNLEYSPPGGTLGTLVAKLFAEQPGQQVQEDLRRLKQLMEAGEIPTTEGQPSGRARGRLAAVAEYAGAVRRPLAMLRRAAGAR